MDIRTSQFTALTDEVDYYAYLVDVKKRKLSDIQREALHEAATKLKAFGDAGWDYYDLAMDIIKTSESYEDAQEEKKMLNI